MAAQHPRAPLVRALAAVALAFATLAAHASLSVFVGEPFGSFGTMMPLGHTAIYLDHVCADGPLHVRPCSPSALDELVATLRQELPELPTAPLAAEYGAALATLAARPEAKAVLFVGSNIGNFAPAEQLAFLRALAAPLSPADRLLVGFDLRKDPRRIRAAYDDAQGVTAEFNLNLLRRFNTELGADFELEHWQHFPDYDPSTGAMRSWLVSRRAQTVRVAALAGQAFEFAAWEAIHTENSFKFTLPQITNLAAEAGLRVVEVFQDAQGDFADVVLAVAG